MSKISWKENKKRIERLIDLISEHYGGDEKSFLLEYKSEVIDKYKYNLELAVKCFEDLYAKTGKPEPKAENKKGYTHQLHCGECGYRPLFCSCPQFTPKPLS